MISFGNRVEMFVDSYLIAESDGAKLTLNRPLCRGKVLGFDEPWESPGSLGLCVFDDGGVVKMYYRGSPKDGSGRDEEERQVSCLAVSEDGLSFAKPSLGRVEYEGSTDNNIQRLDGFCHNFTPFIDTNPACKPEERYKAIGGVIYHGGIHVFASPDGLNWKLLHDGPVITHGSFDSMNTAFYDEKAGVYRCYSRYMTGPEIGRLTPGSCRAIQSCTSTDFIHWTHPVPNEYTGMPEITEHFYTNATRAVPGAGHILVSFPMRYNQSRKKVPEAKAPGVSDCVFMTSRDGVHWDRTFPEAFIAPGLSDHEWTHRSFITLSGIIERGDDFYIYSMKNYTWEDDGIWCYSVPRFRFASMYAGYAGGSFTTKPLRFASDTFCLNYSTAAYGDVKITAYAADGTVLGETDLLYGNELSRPVTFSGIAGREGYLRFALRDAHVYAVGSDMVKAAFDLF